MLKALLASDFQHLFCFRSFLVFLHRGFPARGAGCRVRLLCEALTITGLVKYCFASIVTILI